jgi:BlaI family penicillinase repressor
MISKEAYSKEQMKRLVTDYYNNSLSQVVNFFTESKKLDEKELDEAMSMLAALKAKRNNVCG